MNRVFAPARDLWVYLALVLLIATAYAQVRSFEFVSYDDGEYVTNNPHVRVGLTPESVSWAFTSGYGANWFPLTWLSLMLGCQLHGIQSGWHHLTNVLLHTITTLLLFGLLRRMTGAFWRSAFVAFVFALHPMHVEAVAWVAERKEVLSGLFWLLTLGAYVSYTKRPGILRYLLVVAMFLGGTMSKPMIVTLPFALLLIDVWPLSRWTRATAGRLILEKLPLLGISAVASIIAFLVQSRGGAVSTLELLPFGLRIKNALISYVIYVLKFFWPANMSVIYPYPQQIPVWQAIGAGLIIAGISIAAIVEIRRRPYLFAGWFWFLGTLIPVIQLVQIGLEPRANRYTYIPYIGLSIIVAWGVTEMFERQAWGRLFLPIAGAAVCAACFVVTHYNLGYWRNSQSLFEHAIEVTSNNWAAHLRLSQVLLDEGRVDDAVPHIRETVRLRPNLLEARINLGAALSKRAEFQEAETEYRAALRIQPDNADAHEGLGVAATEEGRFNEALTHLTEAVRLRPDDPDSHYNLGRAYGLAGRTSEAIEQFTKTVQLQPNNAEAHFNLGTALAVQDRLPEACDEFSRAVRLNPNDVNARFNLGSAFGTLGRLDEAIEQFQEVIRLKPDFDDARHALDYCLRVRQTHPPGGSSVH